MLEGLSPALPNALPLHAVRPEGLDALLGGLPPASAAFLRGSGFAARAGQHALLPGPDGIAGAVVGLGQTEDPWAYGGLPRALPAGSAWRLAPGAGDASLATLGWALGAYRPGARRKSGGSAPALLEIPAGTEAALAMAEAMCAARDLINTPAGELGPVELGEAVAALAARHGASCEIVAGDDLARGFPAVAAVGGGSHRPPRVAMLRWTGAEEGPLIALCGKGVCFDTGGLDLKPPAGMLRMKKDMAGAAIVMAVAESVMRARLPVRLLVLVGAVENAISATAFRPMDVLTTRKGLTVEVGNTDAEGRLVLCDLLTFAAEMQPSAIFDVATLTGAARVALGPDLPALFCNDETLADQLLAAGQAVQDPMWRLPLHNSYVSWLESSFADISNVGQKPMAGAIIAALFLQRFVPAGIAWAHMDVYAWNDATRAGRPEGGEAQCVRALHAMIVELSRRHSLAASP